MCYNTWTPRKSVLAFGVFCARSNSNGIYCEKRQQLFSRLYDINPGPAKAEMGDLSLSG